MNAALANLTIKLAVFRIRNFVQDAQRQPEICIQNLSYHYLGKIGKVSSQTFFTANNIPEQFLKGWLPFPNHHFGYPAVSFRECIPKMCLSCWTIQNRLAVFFSSPDLPQAAQAFPIHQSFTRSGAVLGEAVFWRGDDCERRGWLKKNKQNQRN